MSCASACAPGRRHRLPAGSPGPAPAPRQRHRQLAGEPQHEFLAEDVWQRPPTAATSSTTTATTATPSSARFPILSTRTTRTSPTCASSGAACCTARSAARPFGRRCTASACTSRCWRSRRRQMDALAEYLEDSPPRRAADHRRRLQRLAQPRRRLPGERLGLTEAFGSGGAPGAQLSEHAAGLRLDRIYVRGFACEKAEVHYGAPWSQISDHALRSRPFT
jgi:hypothetical protein